MNERIPHEEVMASESVEIEEETLSDGSTAFNIIWANGIDSRIIIACCDEKSATLLAKILKEGTVGFDVLQE